MDTLVHHQNCTSLVPHTHTHTHTEIHQVGRSAALSKLIEFAAKRPAVAARARELGRQEGAGKMPRQVVRWLYLLHLVARKLLSY